MQKAGVGSASHTGLSFALQSFHQTALTMSSMTFLASPNTIMVLSM